MVSFIPAGNMFGYQLSWENGSMTQQILMQRAVRFYDRYGWELESIRKLLHIQLDQLALAYTLENGLPRNAVQVVSRTKELKNFVLKLEKMGWPDFYLPTEVVHDLIGARLICWFQDDCYGMLDLLQESIRIGLLPDSVEDYIAQPKPSGYRAIHILGNITYDQVVRTKAKHHIAPGRMICEIQIRTLLQDAWGELTHQMHYKISKGSRIQYNELVSTMADHLAAEDGAAVAIRKLMQLDEEQRKKEGFRTE
jgi:putative GTP pyrophosphokinase